MGDYASAVPEIDSLDRVGDIPVGRRLCEAQWRRRGPAPDVADRHVQGVAESSGELDPEMAWRGVRWLLTGTAGEAGEGAVRAAVLRSGGPQPAGGPY